MYNSLIKILVTIISRGWRRGNSQWGVIALLLLTSQLLLSVPMSPSVILRDIHPGVQIRHVVLIRGMTRS